MMVSAVAAMAFACSGSASPPPAAPPPAQAPAPAAGPPPTACTIDRDCTFASNSAPARCVATAGGAASQVVKPDGACVCHEGQCALRPSGPRISQQACNREVDNCNLEPTTGRCEPDLVTDEENPRVAWGPGCRCEWNDSRCHLYWFDPVPCQTTDDCWVEEKPMAHPIARPMPLRGREFRGCVDGERVPACADGRCTLRALAC